MESLGIFGFLFAPQNQPFAIALGMLLGLLLIEVATFAAGVPASAKLDALLDLQGPDADVPDHDAHGGLDLAHEPGVLGTAWDWLNAGRVPLLVLLMILLGAFGSIGYMIEGVSHSVFGLLPATVAAIPALLIALPLTRRTSLLVAKVVPRDETYAVSAEDLVGRTAIITLGPLTKDSIARVMVRDVHGNQHFPWVRTNDPALDLKDGEHVLLVERQSNDYYLAIKADERLVSVAPDFN